MTDRPILLVTNDDGVQADGLRALREALLPVGHVVVVAPAYEQSASSHAITLDRPLRHREHATDVHSIDGTPADCVYLALFEPRFLPRRPDLVLSGINHGPNLGTSVYYSGTVAGAREAALRGIPAVAFSKRDPADPQWVAEAVQRIARRLLHAKPPEGPAPLFNVNFPSDRSRGMRVTHVGRHVYEEDVVVRHDPGGREYFWIGGEIIDYGEAEGSDREAVDAGYTSVTPLELEATRKAHRGLAESVVATEGTPTTEDPTENGETP